MEGEILKITDFFSFLGGLALFLHGMQMMSGGLEAVAGNKMKQMMSFSMMPLRESKTFVLFMTNFSGPLPGIFAGMIFTAIIQSSSAIHLVFNVIGTVLFTVICMTTPLTSLIEKLTPGKVAAQIANMHTLFNLVTTLFLLPFGNYLALLATQILPEKIRNLH